MKKTTMNKIMKIVTVLVIIAMIATMMSAIFAAEGASGVLSTLQGNTTAANQITGIISNVIGIVQVICYAAAIIMLIILGVQFITASPEGKATSKKSAIQYVIGPIIEFAAGTLLGIIANMSNSAISNNAK